MTKTRKCRLCGKRFVLTAAMIRHWRHRCMTCMSSAAVEWARKNRARKRASNSKYAATHMHVITANTRLYRARYPHIYAAHYAVKHAVRYGRLVAKPCAKCGAKKAHAHHDDYSKPLKVIWLCHRHHMERHSNLDLKYEGISHE